MATRIERFRRLLAEKNIDAAVLSPGSNLFYLTGASFHTGERLTAAVLTREGRAGIILPKMEVERVRQNATMQFSFHAWGDGVGAGAALSECIKALGLEGKSIGIEPNHLRVFELRALEAACPGATFGDIGPLASSLRAVKDEAELDLMAEAARIIDASLHALLPHIRQGATERQLASKWTQEILAAGADGIAFDLIVATGPNAAFPHHSPGDRALQKGDLVILDGGARHHYYCSDITRTVAIGEPPAKAREIYEVTLAANLAGIAAARPGATGAGIDAAARKVIDDAGFGEFFLHRTGHGLGMEVHEAPYMAPGSDAPLAPGAVFTVEPGIYLDNFAGVRIEDDIVITPAGARSLTQFPKQLMVL